MICNANVEIGMYRNAVVYATIQPVQVILSNHSIVVYGAHPSDLLVNQVRVMVQLQLTVFHRRLPSTIYVHLVPQFLIAYNAT